MKGGGRTMPDEHPDKSVSEATAKFFMDVGIGAAVAAGAYLYDVDFWGKVLLAFFWLASFWYLALPRRCHNWIRSDSQERRSQVTLFMHVRMTVLLGLISGPMLILSATVGDKVLPPLVDQVTVSSLSNWRNGINSRANLVEMIGIPANTQPALSTMIGNSYSAALESSHVDFGVRSTSDAFRIVMAPTSRIVQAVLEVARGALYNFAKALLTILVVLLFAITIGEALVDMRKT